MTKVVFGGEATSVTSCAGWPARSVLVPRSDPLTSASLSGSHRAGMHSGPDGRGGGWVVCHQSLNFNHHSAVGDPASVLEFKLDSVAHILNNGSHSFMACGYQDCVDNSVCPVAKNHMH